MSRRVFQITGDYLEISGSVYGQKVSQRILLRSLDPAFRYSIRRMHVLLMVHLVLMAFLLRLMMWGLANEQWPEGLRGLVLHVLAIPLLSVLVGMIVFWPKFECFRFVDQWGRSSFFIFREKKQSAECTAFLEELVAQIERPGQILSQTDSREIAMDGLRYRGAAEAGWFWKAALAGGAAAAVFPLLPGMMQLLEPWGFFLVFGCAALGAGMGIMSLISKETMRFMAFLGIVFSLIPVLFY